MKPQEELEALVAPGRNIDYNSIISKFIEDVKKYPKSIHSSTSYEYSTTCHNDEVEIYYPNGDIVEYKFVCYNNSQPKLVSVEFRRDYRDEKKNC